MSSLAFSEKMSFSLSLRQSEFSNFHVEQAHKGHRYPIDFEIRSKDSSFTTRPHRRHCQSPTVASRNVPKRLLWIDREQVIAAQPATSGESVAVSGSVVVSVFIIFSRGGLLDLNVIFANLSVLGQSRLTYSAICLRKFWDINLAKKLPFRHVIFFERFLEPYIARNMKDNDSLRFHESGRGEATALAEFVQRGFRHHRRELTTA